MHFIDNRENMLEQYIIPHKYDKKESSFCKEIHSLFTINKFIKELFTDMIVGD